MKTTNLTRRIMSFNEVKDILVESLALDENVKINKKTKIIDLKAEPIDVLDIYFKLGIPFAGYISGEKLNERGKRVLLRMGELRKRRGDLEGYSHFCNLANSKTTNEYINQLMAGDLISLQNYGVAA